MANTMDNDDDSQIPEGVRPGNPIQHVTLDTGWEIDGSPITIMNLTIDGPDGPETYAYTMSPEDMLWLGQQILARFS